MSEAETVTLTRVTSLAERAWGTEAASWAEPVSGEGEAEQLASSTRPTASSRCVETLFMRQFSSVRE